MNNQFNSKGAYSKYLNTSGNRSLMNPYCLNPLFDPSMFAAMLTSGMSGGMMDPLSAMNYLNQMGSYQDILRQYQNNLSSMTNLATSLSNASSNATIVSNVLTMSTASSNQPPINTTPNLAQFGNLNNLSNLTVKQMLSLANSSASTAPRSSTLYQQSSTKTTATTSTIKERPDISITPVGTSNPYKQKPPKHPSQNDPFSHLLAKQAQTSKSIPQSTNSQVSLLKPPVQPKMPPFPKQISAPSKISAPPKQVSAPQIRVSKSLLEPQPAHNSSLSFSSLKGSALVNPSHSSLSVKQTNPSNFQGRSGTSLQHKLLSKKQPQPSTSLLNPMKKQKSTKFPLPMPSTFHSLLNPLPGSSQPFLPSELSVSMGPVSKGQSSKPPSFRKQKPSKPMEVSSSLSQSNTEALSMLSQLQHHSGIEIIPQQKSQTLDFPRNLPASLSVVPQSLPESVKTSNDISVFELPRKQGNVSSGKRNEKPAAKDNVEIITLDD